MRASKKESIPHSTTTAVPLSRSTTSVVATTGSEPATTTSTHAPPGLSLLVEPEDGMTPIDNFMSSARQSLDMTMYELSDTTAERTLIADHDRGVKVRVLLDRDYSGASVNQAAYATLSAAGVPVAWANRSEIFHQKTITVDDTESAIMTGNLTPKYYSTTRDFVVMDGQTPDVSAIESTFNSDWSGAAPSPAPPGTDLVWSPGSQSPLVGLVESANHSVTVENEEMDSAAIEAALKADAQRGVNVTVIMTSDSEWDTAFSTTRFGRRPRSAVSRHVLGALHPRQGDRCRQHHGLHRIGELLDREPRLQPGARSDHPVDGCARTPERHLAE